MLCITLISRKAVVYIYPRAKPNSGTTYIYVHMYFVSDESHPSNTVQQERTCTVWILCCYLVISFFLKRRSYWAEIAREATNEQSETIVCANTWPNTCTWWYVLQQYCKTPFIYKYDNMISRMLKLDKKYWPRNTYWRTPNSWIELMKNTQPV